MVGRLPAPWMRLRGPHWCWPEIPARNCLANAKAHGFLQHLAHRAGEELRRHHLVSAAGDGDAGRRPATRGWLKVQEVQSNGSGACQPSKVEGKDIGDAVGAEPAALSEQCTLSGTPPVTSLTCTASSASWCLVGVFPYAVAVSRTPWGLPDGKHCCLEPLLATLLLLSLIIRATVDWCRRRLLQIGARSSAARRWPRCCRATG